MIKPLWLKYVLVIDMQISHYSSRECHRLYQLGSKEASLWYLPSKTCILLIKVCSEKLWGAVCQPFDLVDSDYQDPKHLRKMTRLSLKNYSESKWLGNWNDYLDRVMPSKSENCPFYYYALNHNGIYALFTQLQTWNKYFHYWYILKIRNIEHWLMYKSFVNHIHNINIQPSFLRHGPLI